MSIKGQGHSFTLVKVHSDFKVKCLTFGLYTQMSDSGPLGPLVYICIEIKIKYFFLDIKMQLVCLVIESGMTEKMAKEVNI